MPFLPRNVAQPGSALAWGARGRGFKSRRSDDAMVGCPVLKTDGILKITTTHEKSSWAILGQGVASL